MAHCSPEVPRDTPDPELEVEVLDGVETVTADVEDASTTDEELATGAGAEVEDSSTAEEELAIGAGE